MWLRLALLLAFAAAGCTREHSVDLRVDVRPLESSGSIVRALELRAYRAASCADVRTIVAGTDSADRAQSFRADAPASPLGALSEGTWSFAAVARDASCRPIGYGCTTVRIGEDASITVTVGAVPVALPGEELPCSGGLACTDGLCGSAPAMCTERCDVAGELRRCCGTTCVDTQNDPMNCGGCGIVCRMGACADSRCVEDCPDGACVCSDRECVEGTTCCSERCTSTASDAANCGGCGHACPASLACGAGLCRVAGPVESIEVRLPDTRDCNPMLAVVVSAGTDPGGTDLVAALASPVALETGSLALDEPDGTTPEGWCGDLADCEVAVGVVMLLSDRNADGALSTEEIRSGPLYGVARDGIVVYAARDLRPGDTVLQELEVRRDLQFPEGVAAGVYPYVRTDAELGWIPIGGTPVWSITPCTAPSCDMVVSEDCRAMQPSPITL